MISRNRSCRQVACVLLAVCLTAIPSAAALSWRIYAGWDECVSAYMPDHQWDLLQHSLSSHDNGTDPGQVPTAVFVEAGILVADEYGSEAYRGAVDVTLFDTAGKEIKALTGIQDAEIEVDAHGTKGPWKMCFKVDRNGAYRAPSLLIELSYFTVNHRSLLGTSYEHEKTTQLPLPPNAALDHPHASPHFDKDHMPTVEQVNDVMDGLVMLDAHIQSLEYEAHHLTMRTTRHLKTIKSTHFRTMFYYVGIYAAIVAASFIQVAGVRYMFSGSVGSLPISLGRMNMHGV